MNKLALAQGLLRALTKRAGLAVPLGVAAGLGAVAVGHTASKGMKKAVEYQQGFHPGRMPGGHQ